MRKEMAALVDKAIDRLIESESELLELDVSERALSHHLARCLGELVSNGLKVDVEYNRHFANPKRLDLPPRKALDREIRATTVFPDIIIHRRNSDDNNLLVLELKKPGEDTAYDDLKLRAFRRELRYAHTAHVILGKHSDGHIVREVIWVEDGAENGIEISKSLEI